MVDEIDVIRRQIDKRVPRSPEGTIIGVNAAVAYVQRAGSSQIIPCAYDPQQGVERSKRCTYRWIQGRKKYVIESVFGAPGAISPGDQNRAGFELAPPANLQSSADVSGVLLTWNCPPQQDITFELQVNASPTDVGAGTFRTRGGQFRYLTASAIYFRVRSITEDWRRSSWTAWASQAPGSAGGSGADEDAIHDNVAGEIAALTEKASPAAGDWILIEDSAAGNGKKKAQVGNLPGGSGTDENAIHINEAGEYGAAGPKSLPHGADYLLLEDSQDSFKKKYTNIVGLPFQRFGNIAGGAANLWYYFETYENDPTLNDRILIEHEPDGMAQKYTTLSRLPGGIDPTAIHDNVAGEIAAVIEETAPSVNDVLLIERAGLGNVKRRVTIASLGAALATGGVINITIRVVTSAGSITITTADYLVVVNKSVGETTTVNLPASPTTGDSYVIKDGRGDAASNNITIVPASGNIDGAASYVLNQNYASIVVTYNGSQWNVL